MAEGEQKKKEEPSDVGFRRPDELRLKVPPAVESLGIARWVLFTISLVGGIVGAIVIVLPLNTLLLPYITFLPLAVLVIGLIEETFKPIGFMITARKRPDWFTSKKDGAICGALAGLGFGALENLLYAIQYGTGVLLLRSVMSLPLHIGASALMGVGIYFALKEREEGGMGRFAFLFMAAVIVHAAYNYILFTMA